MAQHVSNKTPEILFISSNKKKQLLSITGYIYYQNKSTVKVSYWSCEEKMCWAGVHLDSQNNFIKFTESSHTHLPVPERVEVRKLMANVKARVHTETTAIGQIYNEELAKANLSKSALAVASTAREASTYRRMFFE